MPKLTARKVMPMKRMPSSAAIAASVVAAFFDSGGWKAGTPVAMASVPVRATAPAAKARRRSRVPTCSGTLLPAVDDRRREVRVFAADDDPERADRDHEERRPDEEVGRDREDVARLADAAEVADRDQRDGDDADDHPFIDELRDAPT